MEFNSLNELFVEWKTKQSGESEKSCKETFPKNENGQNPEWEIYKDSFCADGYLTDKENFNGILFILKESNTQGSPEHNDTFWFKGCLDGKIKGNDANRWGLYCSSMKAYLKQVFDDDSNYNKCAYMNLNKRGGFGKCNDEQLTNYVKEYGGFIKRQIELIKPKYIFCCGADTVIGLVEPIVKEIAKGSNVQTDITLYNCYHLCCTKRIIKNR